MTSASPVVVGSADPFAAAGIAPAEGSWIRSTDGWREQILTWFAQGPRAGEWRDNGEFFDAFDAARLNAGIRKRVLVSYLRGLVAAGRLEKRIDYTRQTSTWAMPFVEHRAVLAR